MHDRIHWTPARKMEFVELWNHDTPRNVALHFGMDRPAARNRAHLLRVEGYSVRKLSPPTDLPNRDRATLEGVLITLCVHYKTTPQKVLDRSRVQDGRLSVRRALSWAAHRKLGLSLKQIAIFFNCGHPAVVYWENTSSEREREIGESAVQPAREARVA